MVAIGGLCTLSACSNEPTGTSGISRVVVSPSSVDFSALGDTLRLTATARDAVGNAIDGVSFSWSSTAASVRVDDSGLLTAVSEGRATVRATTQGETGESDVIVLQVTDSVAVSPSSLTLAITGGTHPFTAAAWDSNGNPISGATFDWSSSDTTVATVNSTGLVTVVAIGQASITAAVGAASDAAMLTVVPVIASIEVDPQVDTLTAFFQTVRLTAVAKDPTGNDISGITFSWSALPGNVINVDSTGLVTGLQNGSAQVTAEVAGVEGMSTIVVKQRADSVAVSPSSPPAFDALADTAILSGNAWDANGYPIGSPTFDWTSSDTTVAAVDANGVVTSRGNGDATITATMDGASADAAVSVAQLVANVVVTPTLPDTLRAFDDTQQFTAIPIDRNGFAVPGQNVQWSSTDTLVAAVNQSGLATAVRNGTTNIVASVDAISGQAPLVVSQRVDRIQVTPNFVLLSIGDTQLLTATAYDSNNFVIQDVDFDWDSTDSDIASVTPLGTVRAWSAGEVDITATADGVSGIATVFVEGPPFP
jgi:uncharacterized protein YjdB